MSYINLSQAFAQWQELAANIPKNDGPALAESWNDYTDSLCKDGQLCVLQYHYCPAYDDDMPGTGSQWNALSDDREFILDAMGVTLRYSLAKNQQRDGWAEGSTHWRVTLVRNKVRFTVDYSMGSAAGSSPEICDVVNCLLLDCSLGKQSFPDFCSELGRDTDSRKAHADWKSCKKALFNMHRLFTASEISDLRDLFSDM